MGRITGEEYMAAFLSFHAQLYLNNAVSDAAENLPILCSSLSTLVATAALTRTQLIQVLPKSSAIKKIILHQTVFPNYS